jgi:pyrimidine deaminase RibD-like protein
MSTPQTPHTPIRLPWKVSETLTYVIKDTNDKHVATCQNPSTATFIVHRVNTFEALKESLQRFGRHAEACALNKNRGRVVLLDGPADRCNCGFTEALQLAESRQGEDDQ